MNNDNVIKLPNRKKILEPLTELLRSGARKLKRTDNSAIKNGHNNQSLRGSFFFVLRRIESHDKKIVAFSQKLTKVRRLKNAGR